MNRLLLACSAILLAPLLTHGQEVSTTPLHRIHPQSVQNLQAVLSFKGQHLPFVSAHRGGPAKGFPENCIPTFGHTLQHTFAMLEIDPRRTKDGAIVLLHDATLERTTTGVGRVTDFTLAELKKLHLKDPKDRPPPFSCLPWMKPSNGLVAKPSSSLIKKTSHPSSAHRSSPATRPRPM